jgi:hypothetical protein
MTQVKQWFSILQPKRLGTANFWFRKSFDKVLAECEKSMAQAA